MDLKTKVSELPQNSGVYIMKNAEGVVIYVGKAKNLKNRVSQYFQHSRNHTIKVRKMVENIADFYYIVTPNEAEALALENNLIKRYQPFYNILLKDGKSYPYIRIDLKKDFPNLEIVRKIKRDGAKYDNTLLDIGNVSLCTTGCERTGCFVPKMSSLSSRFPFVMG